MPKHKNFMMLINYIVTEKKNLQITVEKESGLEVSSPKHGKVDEKNEPHVGGNTWAGGTGGRDTAGLGGKGGPYRLDAKHKVFQVTLIMFNFRVYVLIINQFPKCVCINRYRMQKKMQFRNTLKKLLGKWVKKRIRNVSRK